MKYSVLAPLAIAMLLAATTAQAQLYKWVAPDGTVSFSDKPPPANAAKVERKSYAGGGSSLDQLPFELANAAKGSPVTLYTNSGCGVACDMGRKFLVERGIPYSEKLVDTEESFTLMKKQAGDIKFPTLVVGRNKQTGFNSGEWGGALTVAGYPTSNMMPKTYKNPGPEPLAKAAPAASAASAPQPDDSQKPAAPAPQPTSDKPGFRF